MSGAGVDVLVPRDVPRQVNAELFASQMGWYIGSNRHGSTTAASAREFFSRYQVDVDEDTFDVFIEDVISAIKADRVFDSEENQARRACVPAVREWIARLTGAVTIVGWMGGETVRVGRRKFELTGTECPRCVVNPLAHGLGGGVRCVSEQCGYWYCI